MIQYPFEANHLISLIAYPPSVLDTALDSAVNRPVQTCGALIEAVNRL